MVSSRVQLSKALYLIVLTEFGSTMEVMALQSTKAVPSISVTPEPRLTVFRLWQVANAWDGMRVTCSGSVIDAKAEHPENTPSPMLTTLSGIWIEANSEHP